MTKSAADVEREVEASRGNLDRTVEALKDKMTPGQLFDEASHALGGAGQEVLSKFIDQAKENPMPLAVMGVGLAWLMTTSGKKADRPLSYEERAFAPSPTAGVGDKVHALGEKASGLVTDVRDKVSDATSAAADAGRSAADKAAQYGQQAKQSFTDLLEREPLLLGAAGLLVGAAIGAALPSTDAEDRMVGATRDKIVDKAKDLAQTGLQQAGDVAQAAYSTVKSELQQSADGDASPAERAEAAVHAGAKAVREELQGPAN